MFAALKAGKPVAEAAVSNGAQNDEKPSTPVGGKGDHNSSQSRATRGPQAKVFGIPQGTSEDDLKAYFEGAGSVKSVRLLPIREGKDTHLGFVDFETDEGVNKAVEMFDRQEFQGSNLKVMPGQQQQQQQRSAAYQNGTSNGGGGAPGSRSQAKVFGVPEGTSQEDVKAYFEGAGTVKFVKILPLREGKDTHLAFVEFESDDQVNKAVEMFDGEDFNGSKLKVMVGQQQQQQRIPPKFDGGVDSGPWSTNNGGMSNGPTSRIPREEKPSRDSDMVNGSYMVPDFQSSACRRCGETGHMARECLNAPVSDGSMAVTYIPPPPPETEQEIFTIQSHEGINFEKYESIPVKVTGDETPQAITTFEQAKLHQKCLTNIRRAKYSKPTPVQKYALPSILSKRDLMACAQTGSGKTAAFLLPIITNLLNEGVSEISSYGGPAHPLCAIMAPTRELAVQIFHEAKKFAFDTPVKPCVIYGGVNVAYQTERLQMGCHILVATPGRLNDFVKKGKVSFQKLQYLVLDEADRMLDMGFGPQINEIIDASEMPPKTERTTLMFSATFPDSIQQMAQQFLNSYLFLTVGRVGGTCSDVQQTILKIPGSDKRNTLEKILQESGTDRTLVFVERKRDADFLASFLSQRNYPATSLNADRSQQEREEALKDFRAGKAPVLVATAVAGRGLDINDVKHVINYDLPNDPTEYVHRIGRTGRIGNKGRSTSFYDTERDEKLARHLVRYLSEAEQDVPSWLEEIALSAVGTGYGNDAGQSHDRRERFNKRPGGMGHGPVTNGHAAGQGRFQAPAASTNGGAVDDDDEEW